MVEMLQQMHVLKLGQRKAGRTVELWPSLQSKGNSGADYWCFYLTGRIAAHLPWVGTEGSSAGRSSWPYQPLENYF